MEPKISRGIRIVQRQRFVLVRIHLEAGPTLLLAVCSAGSQEVFIRVACASGIIAHDDMGFGIADEMPVFVVDKDELCTTVREDVVDLVLGQADIDRGYNRTGPDDALQCL